MFVFRDIVIFLLFLVVSVSAPFMSNAAENKTDSSAIKVSVSVADIRQIQTLVEAVGTTKATRSVSITALSDGIVREVAFKDSQQVAAGDVLVRLDDEIERADLAEAEARLKDARQSLERSRSLKKRDAVAASMVDKLEAEVEIAKAERERAARRLSDRTLKAPFSGRIGFSDIEIGSLLKENETVAVLDDLSSIDVEFFLPETLYAKVRVGASILADAAAFEGVAFKGQVEAIDSRINENSRSFKVRAQIVNEDGLLPAGMFLHLSLILDAEGVLSIPEEAVIIDGAQNYVFVLNEAHNPPRVIKNNVRLGRRSFGWVEVVDGVKQGQKVVTRGIQKVRDGREVEPIAEKEPSVQGN